MFRLALILFMLVPASFALSDESFKIVSFNIRYGTAKDGAFHWRHRCSRVMETIRLEAPDILGLQEVLHFQLEALQTTFPHYSFFGVGRTDGKRSGEYAPIAWQTKRFELVSGQTHWLSDTPTKPGSTSWGNRIPRIATEIELKERSTGLVWHIVNTHLDHQSASSRAQSAAAIVRLFPAAPKGPAIIMGDFNMGETAPGSLVLKENGWQDSFRVIQPKAKEVGTFVAWTDRRTGAKIDAIYVNTLTTVTAAEIVRRRFDGKVPSDHDPVSAALLGRTP